MAQAWSPSSRGSQLRVSVHHVLEDATTALAAVLDATPGWQVRIDAFASPSRRLRRRPLPAPPLPHTAAAALRSQAGASQAATVEHVSGAMTNLVYRCSSPDARAHTTVIVRVFGQAGKLFSQRDERNIFLLASDLGLGPKCLVGAGGCWSASRGCVGCSYPAASGGAPNAKCCSAHQTTCARCTPVGGV